MQDTATAVNSMQVYNSLSRRKERFEPGDPRHVTMYVCGPTVYSPPHIGNARPAVVFDVLYRLLKRLYPGVTYARNITDIDDKINASALEQGVDISVISARFTEIYHQDMNALGVLPPDAEPRATENVPDMVAMIQVLLDKGHAYEVDGHVLFDVTSYDAYGTLARRDRREMIAGARVEVAPYKKDPADFVLWKPSDPSQPGWDSPWGRGRPGWHLECSAMIESHLGRTIDIHGGGHDLQFPHHENEIAQSTCAHDGALYCRYWMHNGFVNVDAEKMSKSLGNVLSVRELLQQAPGEAIRFALLSAHYRKPLDWDDETLPRATHALDALYQAVGDEMSAADNAADDDPAFEALLDDLNTPQAIAELHALSRQISGAGGEQERRIARARLRHAGASMGLLGMTQTQWNALRQQGDLDVVAVEQDIAHRNEARAQRRFDDADRIRDRLVSQGIVLKDHPDGTTTWQRA